eukprot:CAMPEP_0177320702 /NCGR_PEP_ID=MMETSP0368-20130122/15275_1 /TAXON_ID=447022 ORGANISM="Scrippsiella hangoei-like, Strain SHHI-4" /NCGR_SAMPLE_ID=MMETSP0368 /ASSEMBLY_ACC=CAM_ASM_000363 /LENGTH=843 /DNA_ID=CAMNT_0018780269 /DNA_START=61 /DNA_END=2596 /DNA_ORIENTATION=+
MTAKCTVQAEIIACLTQPPRTEPAGPPSAAVQFIGGLLAEAHNRRLGILQEHDVGQGAAADPPELLGHRRLVRLAGDRLLVHVDHGLGLLQGAVLDLQAGVVLLVLALADALPVVPEAALVPRLVGAPLRGERVVLELRLDGLDAAVVLRLLRLVLRLQILLPDVKLADALLAVLVQTLQHRQGGEEICRALRLKVELQAARGDFLCSFLAGAGAATSWRRLMSASKPDHSEAQKRRSAAFTSVTALHSAARAAAPDLEAEATVTGKAPWAAKRSERTGMAQRTWEHPGGVRKELEGVVQWSGIHPGVQLLDDTQPSDAWWRQARLSLMQAWGTLDAYNTRVGDVHDKQMSMIDLLVLNSDGETPELEMAFDSEEYLLRQSQHDGDSDDVPQAFLQRSSRHSKSRPGAAASASAAASAAQRRSREMQNMGEAGWRRIKESGGRCSALVRLTTDNKDLMVGHTTFSDYSEMNRIFKYYDFPNEDGVVRRMGFSSYPGVAGSTDDYYLLDSGLVITETTISMLTDEPYDKLDDSKVQIPDFMRIMVASRLAKTGAEWAKLMTDTSTGTYSSQWMVVDYNAFIPGSAVKNGTLTVIEQVPGMSRTADMSQRLQQMGFWGSENRAWFEDVRNASGSTEAEELHGALFSADNNPRANIFKATAPKVQTLADMRAELRRNKWPHEVDGGESNTPDHAISARGDLDKSRPNANGGVDSKVTNRCLARLLQCDAISGPTADDQQPFRWQDPATGKELFPGEPHDGLPNEWNFKWERMAPDGAAAAACLAERECTLPDFLGVGRCFASSGGAKGNQAPHHVFIAVVDFNVHEPSYWIVRCGAHDPSLLVRRP